MNVNGPTSGAAGVYATMGQQAPTAMSVSQAAQQKNMEAAQAIQEGATLLGVNKPEPGARIGGNINISV